MRDYRAGRLELFASSRPGPRREAKKDSARTMALTLRREGRSLAEIARALTAAGTPLGRTAIWEVVRDEGLGRLPLETIVPASPPGVAAPKTQRLQPGGWPQAGSIASDHAGLFLLLPKLVDLDIPGLVTAGGYPATNQLTALNSLLSILALKLYERRRRSHVYDVVHDQALGVFCGLTVLPKRSHLSDYSYRTTRAHNQALLEALVPIQKTAGLIDGESFNLDFHAIMSFGQDQILEEHYVPSHSQRTRSVLTFFAQDARHATLCYSNADLAKADQAQEIIRFCEFWQRTSGEQPACSCSTRA